jgi:putative aldouronate transport system permease protein
MKKSTLELEVKRNNRIALIRKMRMNWILYVMLIPGVIITFIYSYIPVAGLVIAFEDYKITKGVFGSDWVGFKNFEILFTLYKNLWSVVRNTVIISFLKYLPGFILPIIVSIMLNEVRRVKFKKFVQSMVYLPHFISWIVVCGIVLDITNVNNGLLNSLLDLLGMAPYNFMGHASSFITTVVIANVWKSFGWSTIIYMAALTGIDPTLYEAASIDGANWFAKIRYITLPGIKGIILLNLALSIGGSLLNAGFDDIYNLQNVIVKDGVNVLDVWIYELSFQSSSPQYSLSTCISILKSLIGTSLTIIFYRIANKKLGYKLF